MPLKLVPEKEREVTPGKKAVEDLEDLDDPPRRDDNFLINGLNACDAEGHPIFSHKKVIADVFPAVRGDIPHGLLELEWHRAVYHCQTHNRLLPSAPLMFEILSYALANEKEPGCHELVSQIDKPYRLRPNKYHHQGEILFHTNTRLDWQRNECHHYPAPTDQDAVQLMAKNKGPWDQPCRVLPLHPPTGQPRPLMANRRNAAAYACLSNIMGVANVDRMAQLAQRHGKEFSVIWPENPKQATLVHLVCGRDYLRIKLDGVHKAAYMGVQLP